MPMAAGVPVAVAVVVTVPVAVVQVPMADATTVAPVVVVMVMAAVHLRNKTGGVDLRALRRERGSRCRREEGGGCDDSCGQGHFRNHL